MGKWFMALLVTLAVPPLVGSGVVKAWRWYETRSAQGGNS